MGSIGNAQYCSEFVTRRKTILKPDQFYFILQKEFPYYKLDCLSQIRINGLVLLENHTLKLTSKKKYIVTLKPYLLYPSII